MRKSVLLFSATFDGEIGKGNQFDTFFSGLVGLKWRIGKQGFRVVRLIPSDQYAALNNGVTKIRRELTERWRACPWYCLHMPVQVMSC
ncbi:MAG: hypothetical protein V8T12_05545 [Parabacteroides johnsonii]